MFVLLIGNCTVHEPLATKPYVFKNIDHLPAMPVANDNPVTEEGVELGRYLFYDTILSADYSFSCASCHRQAVAFSDAEHVLSKGIKQTTLKRNTPPLFNLAWYERFFWDGRATTIEEQVFQPVRAHDEMNLNWNTAVKRIRKSKFYRSAFRKAFGKQDIDSVQVAKAIAQFERTLISTQSKYDRVLKGKEYLSKEEYEGFVLTNDQSKGDCLHCHTTDSDPVGTTGGFSNNGLDRVATNYDYTDSGLGGVTGKLSDYGYFKIPSLRNIAVTAPYMHDGRFQTLKEVLDFYSEDVQGSYNIDPKMQYAHKGGVHLTEDEKSKIIAFLHTLTDSTFLKNKAFASPFLQKK